MITLAQLKRVVDLNSLRCVFRGHDWKRAVRLMDRRGQQQCRRCGALRYVTLRKGKEQPELVRVPKPEAPPSQWPPRA